MRLSTHLKMSNLFLMLKDTVSKKQWLRVGSVHWMNILNFDLGIIIYFCNHV